VTASTTFFLNVIELLAVLAAIAACVVLIFVDLYPNVMVSSTSHAYNLTVHNTASGAYSLKAMTVVVIVFLPLVLGYQAWTYYVFRRRVSASDFRPAAPSPGAASPAAVDVRAGTDTI
jgi:cytochrome d ubiquinol oxidase subunit II